MKKPHSHNQQWRHSQYRNCALRNLLPSWLARPSYHSESQPMKIVNSYVTDRTLRWSAELICRRLWAICTSRIKFTFVWTVASCVIVLLGLVNCFTDNFDLLCPSGRVAVIVLLVRGWAPMSCCLRFQRHLRTAVLYIFVHLFIIINHSVSFTVVLGIRL